MNVQRNRVCRWSRGRIRRLRTNLGVLALTVAALLPGLALAEQDRWEGFNRGVFDFNDALDRGVLKPTAKAYDRTLPGFLKQGIHNVFRNLATPATMVNQLLQGKPLRALGDTGRLLVNTTVGVGGLFDVASSAGLPEHEEDFGQTLRVWGVPDGPFLMVPFRGPATVTHAGGMLVDALLNPVRLLSPARDRYIINGLSVIDSRVALLQTEALVSGDRYLFLRDAYLQRREFLINDGVIDEDPFFDDEEYE